MFLIMLLKMTLNPKDTISYKHLKLKESMINDNVNKSNLVMILLTMFMMNILNNRNNN